MDRTKIAGFRKKSYENLQAMTSKTGTFHLKINGMAIIQRELHKLCRADSGQCRTSCQKKPPSQKQYIPAPELGRIVAGENATVPPHRLRQSRFKGNATPEYQVPEEPAAE
jgi:hypothetical protein